MDILLHPERVDFAFGGGIIEPSLMAMARKYNQIKMICCKCYCLLLSRAVNFRKKRYGHSPCLARCMPWNYAASPQS